jgi:hypothetical protein
VRQRGEIIRKGSGVRGIVREVSVREWGSWFPIHLAKNAKWMGHRHQSAAVAVISR